MGRSIDLSQLAHSLNSPIYGFMALTGHSIREAEAAPTDRMRVMRRVFLNSPTGLAGPGADNSNRRDGSKSNHRGRMAAAAASAEPLAAFAAAAPQVAFRVVWRHPLTFRRRTLRCSDRRQAR